MPCVPCKTTTTLYTIKADNPCFRCFPSKQKHRLYTTSLFATGNMTNSKAFSSETTYYIILNTFYNTSIFTLIKNVKRIEDSKKRLHCRLYLFQPINSYVTIWVKCFALPSVLNAFPSTDWPRWTGGASGDDWVGSGSWARVEQVQDDADVIAL